MKKSILFLIGILFSCSSLSFAQDIDSKLIQDITQNWVDVTNNEDIEGLLKILTNDVIIFSPNAEPAMGKSTIEEIYSPYYQAYDLEVTATINEMHISEKIAYVWTLVEGTRGPKGGNEFDNFNYNNLWILKKNQSGWKLWRLMFNSPS
ncbi:YybH family protein [Rhodohalobacter sp.]|uniref:YybH family protein n=1 Tax=Rhodohalobacter sp. TaxID=1974210 RepID=UPI002ACEAE20|nr:DUF4440 domain-containing protein [Rhodohalobacter sp.]MDZ7757163.1 DUF4440 domain-containing protein [Rhodohalobacter sp.]